MNPKSSSPTSRPAFSRPFPFPSTLTPPSFVCTRSGDDSPFPTWVLSWDSGRGEGAAPSPAAPQRHGAHPGLPAPPAAISRGVWGAEGWSWVPRSWDRRKEGWHLAGGRNYLGWIQSSISPGGTRRCIQPSAATPTPAPAWRPVQDESWWQGPGGEGRENDRNHEMSRSEGAQHRCEAVLATLKSLRGSLFSRNRGKR